MKKIIKTLSILILTLLLIVVFNKSAYAIVDPLEQENNRFGIHIMDENDLEDAANLVNSNGGDWGYVTIVIRADERKIDRWQRAFDKMRRLHLIPIVRIASRQTNSHWEKLTKEDIDSWIYFLNSLNWVTQNRYIVVGNETNHATEWGGEVNPQEYASYLTEFSKRVKDASEDFFILPAGLDASAPNLNNHMDEEQYIRLMLEEEPDLFNHIDGWTSHSYPNPEFSGSAEDTGKGTVKTFEWEVDLIKGLGIEKELPIFITETGWVHDMNSANSSLSNENTVSENFKSAYNNAWNNKNILAITPFVLNYQGEPFEKFSWKRNDGSFYKFYSEVQTMTKNSGEPKQIVSGNIKAVLTPKIIRRKGDFYGVAYVENTGQSIWEKGQVTLIQESGDDLLIEPARIFSDIEPGHKGVIFFKGRNNTHASENSANENLKLASADGVFGDSFNLNIEVQVEDSSQTENNSGILILKSLLDKLSYFVANEIPASV